MWQNFKMGKNIIFFSFSIQDDTQIYLLVLKGYNSVKRLYLHIFKWINECFTLN